MIRTLLLSTALAALVPIAAAAERDAMQIGDTTLPYVDEGDGAPVVFVHGAISDLRVWEPYRARIGEAYRFVAYTQRYFGAGTWPDNTDDFQRSTHVDDLVSFVEGLDAGPVHLVTWSYSGEIGIHAMLRRPDLFRSAVHYEPVLDQLVAGAPGGENATRELFSEFGPAISAAQEGRGEDAALRFIEAVFELPEGGAVGESGEEMWRQNGRTVLPYISMEPPLDVDCSRLASLDAPMLVVQGETSYTRFAIMAERVASCARNALVVTLPNANHDGPYRSSEAFGDMIEGFLAIVE